MPRKNTVKVNYEKLKNAIDQHKKYRGNNTLFCLDMGFEKPIPIPQNEAPNTHAMKG